MRLALTLGGRKAGVDIHTVVVAGWTGRDRGAVESHMAELEAVGVARPSSVPVFYRVSATRLTTATEIESTAASSGEVEPLLLRHEGRLWVGVGSDHTDREVESYGIAVSKQLCDKPLAAMLWPYDDVAERWDQLRVRSWIDDDAPYQEGTLDSLLHPDELLELSRPRVDDGTLMFCGTFPALGGIRPSSTFRYALTDPVAGRTIESRYVMRELPLVT